MELFDLNISSHGWSKMFGSLRRSGKQPEKEVNGQSSSYAFMRHSRVNRPQSQRLGDGQAEFYKAAKAVLQDAMQRTGVSGKPSFIRKGSNFIFQIPEADLAARVTLEPVEPGRIERELALSRSLAAKGVPIVTAPTHLASNPVKLENGTVTFWNWIHKDKGEPIQFEKLGKTVRAFHDAAVDCALDIPEWNFFEVLDGRLESFRANDDFELHAIVRMKEISKELKQRAKEAVDNAPGGTQIIHGDVWYGNALMSEGNAVLLDLERVTRAPRFWDMIPTAVSVRRFGMDARNLDDFLRGYGEEVRAWDGFEVFMKMRELRITTFLFANRDNSLRHRAELYKRLSYWLEGEQSPKQWQAL